MTRKARTDLHVTQANSTDEIVTAARDFVARWSPDDLAAIPPHLRPRKIVDAEDVNSYAVDLVQQQQFAMDPRSAPQLHEMANFFSSASNRLSQILAGEP
jgi:hypothetical protein